MGKAPWLAVFLSKLLPGAGQIYAGNTLKGLAILFALVLFSLTALAGLLGFTYSEDQETSRIFALVGVASVPVIVLLSIYSLFDAYKTAKHYNSDHSTQVETGVKKPWLAVFLCSLFPGIGQFYNRQIIKGIAFIIAAFALYAVTGLFYPLFFLPIALYLFAFKDAFESAEKLNGSNHKFFARENGLIKAFIIGMVLIELFPFGGIVKAHVIQAFKFPSGSMLPTLLIGDHVLVNKTIAAKTSVRRGDLIIFKYPEDPSKDFVKRVVAVEGDTIESKDKRLFINGKAMDEPYVQYTDAKIRPGGIEPRDNFGPYVVPADKFFVMGDNRDQSYDSRYWGYVPKENVKGKAFKIYWSWNNRVKQVRWERIGMNLK